jgi:signal transduction histidine kinase
MSWGERSAFLERASSVSQLQGEIQREEVAHRFGQMAGVRVAVSPLFVILIAGVILVEPVGWRSVVLSAVVVSATIFFVVELIRYRKHGLTRSTVPLNLAAACGGPVFLALATGGIESPVIHALSYVAILVTVLLPASTAWSFVGFQIGAVWLFAVVSTGNLIVDFHDLGFGAQRRPPANVHVYAHAAMLTVVMVIAGQVGGVLRRTFDRMFRRALAAQQASLDAHAEHVRDLTALSAEIAHELKNPLASIKGLATLLSKDLEGKCAERLGVLREEAARMQSVLETFLDVTRPAVPLVPVTIELDSICAEIAALHEGLAHERGVEILVTTERIVLECDPRKFKGILINLVQNAIDASSPGARISVDAGSADDDEVVVRIIDEGSGIDPSLGDVFEPGVTSKPVGGGIGLTIARALARQHGGDVRLCAREPRGTVAEVWLPRWVRAQPPGSATP